MCDASSDPTTYDHPSDHETRISEAAAAVRAVPKRPRVMRVSGEVAGTSFETFCTIAGCPWEGLHGTHYFPEMAAYDPADYTDHPAWRNGPDEPRTPSRWERVRDVLRSLRWTW